MAAEGLVAKVVKAFGPDIGTRASVAFGGITFNRARITAFWPLSLRDGRGSSCV